MGNPTGLWPTFTFHDADKMTQWLQTIGFTPLRIIRSDGDSNAVVHAELLWPAGGGIMYGQHSPDMTLDGSPGHASTYLVTEDVADVLQSAVDSGAEMVENVVEKDYGGQSATVRDAEGNLWTFGQYQPR